MKKLLDYGNRYASQSTWIDFALTKLCLCSMGLVVGTLVSEQHKKGIIITAICVFAATYIPLIVKVVQVARKKDE